MYYRRKILLVLLEIFGGTLDKIDLQKYLFLFNKTKNISDFDFVPYRFGCFSFQANQDLSTLCVYNQVSSNDKSWIKTDENNYLNMLKKEDRISLMSFYNKYKELHGFELTKYVYTNSPYYAINSQVAENILSEQQFLKVLNSKPRFNEQCLFTIGYEGKSVEQYSMN